MHHDGLVKGDVNTIAAYLPSNYRAEPTAIRGLVRVVGDDVAGWTWEGYVVPRLASGLHFVVDR